MKAREIWLSYLLLFLRIAQGDPQGLPRAAGRDLKMEMQEMKMKKWRYSEAAQAAKGKGKHSAKSSMKGSSMMMMMMKQMMMMGGKGKGKGTPYPTPAKEPSIPPPPTPMPTIEVDFGTFERCLIILSTADINRDDILDEQEYVRFINRWSGVTYVGEMFEDLDPLFQQNYVLLAEGNEEGIDVTGSKPGQTVEDDDHLRRYCSYTLTLLQSDDATVTTRAPTPASELLLSECFLAMALSDEDFNSRMNQTEYIAFIDRFTEEEIEAESFDDLDEVLQENFFQSAPEGYIDITGSRPGETPPDELVAVCSSTQAAVIVVLADSS